MAPLGKATHWLPLAVAVSRIAGSGRIGVGHWLRPGPGRITIRSSRHRPGQRALVQIVVEIASEEAAGGAA